MYFRVPEERDISLDKRLEMYAASGEEERAFTFTPKSCGIAMPCTRYREESMFSLFSRRSDIHRARRLVITSLATLGTVLLFGLVNYGLVVTGAFV